MSRLPLAPTLAAAIVFVSLHSGCAHAPTPRLATAPVVEAPAPTPEPLEVVEAPEDVAEVVPAVDVAVAETSALADTTVPKRAPPPVEESDDEDVASDTDAGDIGESHDTSDVDPNSGHLYTADLSDDDLAALWKAEPATLGSISVGFVDEGRIINAQQFPKDDAWIVVDPRNTWATQETVDYLAAALRKVKELHPDAPPLRVNQMSSSDGGYLRPHKSHQNGRDVDLGFYYPGGQTIRARERERHIDVALNWALVKALVTETDVQMILVDKRVQKVMYDHALAQGEDKAWLDSIFSRYGIIRHAKRHRDHFHVRFYNPRAQELGRRLAPLMKDRPEQNIIVHRVRYGDTLGGIALKYGTTISALQKANGLRGSFLKIGQRLRVRMKGPCTRCPVPPPVVVPARKLPPGMEAPKPTV